MISYHWWIVMKTWSRMPIWMPKFLDSTPRVSPSRGPWSLQGRECRQPRRGTAPARTPGRLPSDGSSAACRRRREGKQPRRFCRWRLRFRPPSSEQMLGTPAQRRTELSRELCCIEWVQGLVCRTANACSEILSCAILCCQASVIWKLWCWKLQAITCIQLKLLAFRLFCKVDTSARRIALCTWLCLCARLQVFHDLCASYNLEFNLVVVALHQESDNYTHRATKTS